MKTESGENTAKLEGMCNDQQSKAHLPNEALSNRPTEGQNRLVDAKALLKIIWEDGSRPSLRWLRQQQADGTIPFVKVGARVWFDPAEVRRWLIEHWTSSRRARWKRSS